MRAKALSPAPSPCASVLAGGGALVLVCAAEAATEPTAFAALQWLGIGLLAFGVGGGIGWLTRPITSGATLAALLLWIAPIPTLPRLVWAARRAVTLFPTWSSACLWAAALAGGVVGGNLIWRRGPARWVDARLEKPLQVALIGTLTLPILVLLQPHWLGLGELGAGLMGVAILWLSVMGPGQWIAVATLTLGAGVALHLLPVHYPQLQHLAGAWTVGGCLWLVRAGLCRWRPVQTTWTWRQRLGTPLLLLASFGAAHGLLWGAQGQAEHGISRVLPALVQQASDLDGDGHGALFGGRDCAPTDPEVHPDQHERPGDGRDNNCLAGDGQALPHPRSGLHSRPDPWEGDIILVVIDTLRADEAKPTDHPFFARLAARGLYYTEARATSSFTAMSLPGILAARLPTTVPLRWLGPLVAYPQSPLGGLSVALADVGYASGFVGGLEDEDSAYFSPDHFGHGFARRTPTGRDADPHDVVKIAADAWAAMRSAGRRFLYLHLMSVHEYEIGDRASYRERVRRTADALDGLMATVGDDALWVVTSDHGEEFGEHGGQAHGTTLYDESVRVPLYVSGGDLPRGVVTASTSLLAIMPTLVAMVDPRGAPKGEGPYLCLNPGACVHAPAPLALEMPGVHLHGLVLGQRKIVRNVRSGHVEAYDLRSDPQERTPIAPTPNDLLAALTRWEEGVFGLRPPAAAWPYRQP